jgi:16S rRNA processing protein RimM
LIFLGKIVKTRGNKGEVAVTPSPVFVVYAPEQGEELVLQSQRHMYRYKLDYVKEIQGYPVLKFHTIDSINDAFKLVGYSCFGMRTLKDDGPLEFEDTVDFIVKDLSGCVWGRVKNAETFGINLVLEIIDDNGALIYVPFADGIVKEIDEKNRIIIIDPPDGLKDLNKK